MEHANPATTGTVEKALDVLFHLHQARRACGVSELGRALDLPRSTVHRLLASLHRRGLVDREPGGGYRTGIGLVALGVGVLRDEPVVAAARPVLEEEARACGETLFLAGARGGRLCVLDKVEGSGFLRVSPSVGEPVGVAGTAVGKLHLVFAPERLAEPASVSAALKRELAQVERRRWAANRDEWLDGLTGVAAPIFADGELLAALAIAGPSSRMRCDPRSPHVARVRRAAARVERRLSGELAEEDVA